jgi:hypothetical protein
LYYRGIKKTTMDGVVKVTDKVHVCGRVYRYHVEALDERSTLFVKKLTQILSGGRWGFAFTLPN